VFQPCHGTAPDIVGQGKANPTAMFLSGAMMLEWLGTKHQSASAIRAARLIEAAVSRAYVEKRLQPSELGGPDGTRAITGAVIEALDAIEPAAL
jgi:3-isopropylmalate dehydrogenase